MSTFIKKHYVVNLGDLATYGIRGELNSVRLLLVPHLLKETVRCEGKRWDGDSAIVRRNTEQEQWDAIVKILREGVPGGNLDAIPKYKLRIYESKTGKGSWKRI